MFVRRLAVLTTLSVTLLISSHPSAQTPSPRTDIHQIPTHVYIDSQAVLAKEGSETAIRNLTGQLFANAGIPKEVTSALGFNERVVQAELNYRKGLHPAVQTADIVKAVNNLSNSIGAPTWAHTDAQEVTKLRMWLLVLYPHMIASSTPHQADGNLELLSPKMSPIEASYIATILIQQKLWNSYYQLSPAERIDAQAAIKLSAQRGAQLRAAIQGGTQGHSVRDLLSIADGFFTDLRIDPISPSVTKPVQEVR
jgi:hypothetical protein